MLELVINSIEGLGPLGPAAFVVLVALMECIPLFPTQASPPSAHDHSWVVVIACNRACPSCFLFLPLLQPFSLASGLLFGTQKGALCMLSGTTLAALLAYSIARGIGRPLAERIISAEMSEGEGGGRVQRRLAEVQAKVEQGSFLQQAAAVLLLRLTPIVPFS
jgi:uncharacterized membrane protein YdjX (TVP38/TMEM64 family)